MAEVPGVHDLLPVLKCLGLCWVCKETAKITWQVPQESISCSPGDGEALGGSAEAFCAWSGPIPAWPTDNSLSHGRGDNIHCKAYSVFKLSKGLFLSSK